MKEEIKKRWVKALRSDEYRQARSALRIGERFCCLGVLCDLYRKEKNDPRIDWQFNGIDYVFLGSTIYLPERVLKWAKLKHNNDSVFFEGRVPGVYGRPSLAKLNDSNFSFDEIADRIETLVEVY